MSDNSNLDIQASRLNQEVLGTKPLLNPWPYLYSGEGIFQNNRILLQVDHLQCNCKGTAQESIITEALKELICMHKTKSLDKPPLLSCPLFSCPSLSIFPILCLLFFTDILKSSKPQKQLMPIRNLHSRTKIPGSR